MLIRRENITKWASCDDCGVVFETIHDLQKHVKNWCQEQLYLKRKLPEEDYVPTKRVKYESEEESDVENGDEEDEVFMTLAEAAMENNEEEWTKKVEKYEKDGLLEAEAKEKADKKLREDDLREFMNKYAKMIQYFLKLRNGQLHGKIMDTITNFMDRDIDRIKAIRMTLRKYKYQLEEYMDNDTDEDEESASGEEDTDSDEEDTEGEDTD